MFFVLTLSPLFIEIPQLIACIFYMFSPLLFFWCYCFCIKLEFSLFCTVTKYLFVWPIFIFLFDLVLLFWNLVGLLALSCKPWCCRGEAGCPPEGFCTSTQQLIPLISYIYGFNYRVAKRSNQITWTSPSFGCNCYLGWSLITAYSRWHHLAPISAKFSHHLCITMACAVPEVWLKCLFTILFWWEGGEGLLFMHQFI